MPGPSWARFPARSNAPRRRPPPSAPAPRGGVKATPAVRALARRKGVDLALVSPSGPNGVITVADVERAAADLVEAGPLEPLRGVRRAMATRMAHAHAEVVPATVSDDADLDAWTDGDVTIRIVRAIVAGCAAEPALNAWYDSQQQGAPPASEDRSRHRGRHRGRPVRTRCCATSPIARPRICAAGSSA